MRKTVLIAEDDDVIRALLAEELAACEPPINVLPCADGVKALALVRALRAAEQPVDLLALDVAMGVMDGDEVARAVREEEAAQGIAPVPIVFLSGMDRGDPRLQTALEVCRPAQHLDKRSCEDGREIARRLLELARQALCC